MGRRGSAGGRRMSVPVTPKEGEQEKEVEEAAPLRTQTTLKRKKSALKLLVSDISDQDTVTRLHRAVNSKSDSNLRSSISP